MPQFSYDFLHLKGAEKKNFRKPIFARKVEDLSSAVEWAQQADVSALKNFLEREPERPLVVFGSGGSFSSCQYAAMLVNLHGGFAVAKTPMMIHMMSEESLRRSRFLCISASGRTRDINTAADYLLRRHPDNFAALTVAGIESEKNKLGRMMMKYPSCTPVCLESGIHNDGFVGAKKHVALFTLLYRCFYDDLAVADKIFHADEPPYQLSGGVELSSVNEFHLLHGGLGEAAAVDLESRLVETGIGFSMVSCLKNYTHGRHTYVDKYPQTALVLFETARDRGFAEQLAALHPDCTPIVRMESKADTPLATIELLVRSCYLALDLGLSRGIDPARPKTAACASKLYALDYGKLIKF